jgi:hypothetical protein
MRTILVTGAPRSGTTPVGAALALAPRTRMIYEPMGPTGDQRIPVRYAIPGQTGLPLDVFHAFLDDLQNLRLQLGSQKRQSYVNMTFGQRLLRRIIGSRTKISYLAAKIAPGFSTLVWKDPMAAFALPAVLAHGVPTVLCVRSPLAHAASFKRKGWTVDVGSIYPNFRQCYGPVPVLEGILGGKRNLDSVTTASMLWHMVYLLAYRVSRGEFGNFPASFMLVSATQLEINEMQVYSDIYNCLDLPFEGQPRRKLEQRAGLAIEDSGRTTRTHDWRRSVSATNSYWKKTLSDEEIVFVSGLNSWIFEALEGIDRIRTPEARAPEVVQQE